MKNPTQKVLLVVAMILIVVLPLLGSLFKWNGLPPQFGQFPVQASIIPDPGFDLIYFSLGLAVVVFILAYLIFPQLFGFRRVATSPRPSNTANFPWWFWPGVIVTILCWIAMWGQFSWLEPAVHFTFVPQWWGFILTIDGLVYKRSGGKSLLAHRSGMMVLVALASCITWFLFEYLNYFILVNWYYPDNQWFSTAGYYVWFGLAFTTVIPAVFEWYTLLNTFERMVKKYESGPELNPSPVFKSAVFAVGVLLTFGFPIFPHPLFFALWIGPLLILSGAMSLAGYWTPYTPISKGNWSPITLMALACLFNYFIGEMWNFWSPPNNPNYWKYEIPYVNWPHIFEMPALGFFGYLPFGILCWVAWLWFKHVFNIESDLRFKTSGLPENE